MSVLGRLLKRNLARIGGLLSHRRLRQLEMSLNYLRIGRWMADHGFEVPVRLRDRWEVFRLVAASVADLQVLYLEFGVFQGETIRFWAQQLKHPAARLHGFDSFEGLPEAWDDKPQGFFSTEGRVPRVDDPRVQLFAGWFDEVLRRYTVPSHQVLVINMDADLYSSTITVLRFLRPWIRQGTYIYFDEMYALEHEPRAFHEFMEETGLRFRVVCADPGLASVFFLCEGSSGAAAPDDALRVRGDRVSSSE